MKHVTRGVFAFVLAAGIGLGVHAAQNVPSAPSERDVQIEALKEQIKVLSAQVSQVAAATKQPAPASPDQQRTNVANIFKGTKTVTGGGCVDAGGKLTEITVEQTGTALTVRGVCRF